MKPNPDFPLAEQKLAELRKQLADAVAGEAAGKVKVNQAQAALHACKRSPKIQVMGIGDSSCACDPPRNPPPGLRADAKFNAATGPPFSVRTRAIPWSVVSFRTSMAVAVATGGITTDELARHEPDVLLADFQDPQALLDAWR